MIKAIARMLLAAAVVALSGAARAEDGGSVLVNGTALEPPVLAQLSRAYGAIPPGDYWYDRNSGLWGVTGGPSVGRILPGLALGGDLRAGASGGGSGRLSGVFINGREIHPQEYLYLQALFGVVYPGRYWLGPTLVGGLEGGPPAFDLRAAAQRAGGGAGYNRNTLFGGLMSDGQCSGYLHPGGATVMTGNC